MTPLLWQKAKRNYRASWCRWKRRLKKTGLKLNIQKMKIMAFCPITSWQTDGETKETVINFMGSKITVDSDCCHEIKRHLLLEKKAMTNLDSVLKSRDITTKIRLSFGFSISHVSIRELNHKEAWALKNWCFWTVVLEKTLESSLDRKEIKPVNPEGNQPWIFIGNTDAEASILWPLYVKSWLIRKDPDAGKDWRQEDKGVTEDEIVGWHHWVYGHEPGVGQGNLECCSPWGHKKMDMTERLNNSKIIL